MENPYEGQNYRPYTPPPVYEPESAPNSSVYQGNATFCHAFSGHGNFVYPFYMLLFPYGFLSFRGWAFFFSCLSKGEHRRPGNAKAGMAICVSCLTIFYCSGNIYMHLFSWSPIKARAFCRNIIISLPRTTLPRQIYTTLFTNICMEKISCLIRIQTVTILLMDMTITTITSMTTAAMISMTETFLIFYQPQPDTGSDVI